MPRFFSIFSENDAGIDLIQQHLGLTLLKSRGA